MSRTLLAIVAGLICTVRAAATAPLNHGAHSHKQVGSLTERSHQRHLANESEEAAYMSLRMAPGEGFAEDQIGGRSRGVYVNRPQRGEIGAIRFPGVSRYG